MTEETDGLEETLEGQIRLLVTAAGQVAERLAQARDEQRRAAAEQGHFQARELEARLLAEWKTARAELVLTQREDWWSKAVPEDIARAYQLSSAWAPEQADAEAFRSHLAQEIQRRYGVAPEGTDLALLAEHLGQKRRANEEHVEAARLLDQADRQDREASEAQAADRPDRAAELDAQAAAADNSAMLTFDSAERRLVSAKELENRGVEPSVVESRVRADVTQGRPATEAVSGGRARTRAMKRSTSALNQQLQRGGRSR